MKNKIRILSEKILKLKDEVKTEESTKTSMILPLFQILEYDIFNPKELTAEFIADIGIKKGEKVDYLISKIDYEIKKIKNEKQNTRKNINLWYEALAKLKGLDKIKITLQGLKIFFKYYHNKLTILNKELTEQITWGRYNKIFFNTLENGRDLFFYDLTTTNFKDVFNIDITEDYLFLDGILQGQLKKFRL